MYDLIMLIVAYLLALLAPSHTDHGMRYDQDCRNDYLHSIREVDPIVADLMLQVCNRITSESLDPVEYQFAPYVAR